MNAQTELKGAPVSRAVSQPRRGLRRSEAASYIGVSQTTFDRWIEDGVMPKPIKRGGCAIWDIRKLDVAFDALDDEGQAVNPWNDVSLTLQ